MYGYQDYQSREQRHGLRERGRAARDSRRHTSSYVSSGIFFGSPDRAEPNRYQRSRFNPQYINYNHSDPRLQQPYPYANSTLHSHSPSGSVYPGYSQPLQSQMYPPPQTDPYLELWAFRHDGTQGHEIYHYESIDTTVQHETSTGPHGQHSSRRQSSYHSSQPFPFNQMPEQGPRSSRPGAPSHPLGKAEEHDATRPEDQSPGFLDLPDKEQASRWLAFEREHTPDGCIRGVHPTEGGPAFLRYVDRYSNALDTHSAQGQKSSQGPQRAPSPTASKLYGPASGYTSNAGAGYNTWYPAPPDSVTSRGRQRTRSEDRRRRAR